MPDGAYKIAFSIYEVPTGGTAIWTETYDALQVKGSAFHVLLGSVPYAMVAEKAASATVASSLPPELAQALSPPGSIMAYAGDAAPDGWLLCDGTDVSRTAYAALFSVIGTKYGAGASQDTFALPDLRQRFPIGKSVSGTASTLGEAGGAINHSHKGYGAEGGDLRAVIGTCNGRPKTIGLVVVGAMDPNTGAGFGDPTYVAVGASNEIGGSFSHYSPVVGYTGTSNPPFLVVNYIIKT